MATIINNPGTNTADRLDNSMGGLAVALVVIVLLAIAFFAFGRGLFNNNGGDTGADTNSGTNSGTNIEGTLNVNPGGSSAGGEASQ